MADYCNVRNGGCGGGSTSMGTFRPGPTTSLGYHHSTLTRTTKIGIPGGGGAGGGLSAVEVKERMGTIDGASSQRVRIVRLTRPQIYAHGHCNGGGSFGFSIRGGLEYGTGFFVSAVENDSEADRQGLRVGDQIVRVNGYHVDDAVHRELAQFVSCQERLVLKVRSVGILPVKERSADPLTWHVVSVTTNSGPVPSNVHPTTNGTKKQQHRAELERTSCSSSNSSTSTGSSGTLEELPGGRDLKVILSVAPRTKLGCGICKGPDWKPGIFVQFTKEGGVAREAGLRPGDQILSCNGREFADITFAEAVSIMKASQLLELVVRPGAGIDMFPGESSGYNSSASSVNGDQSPCWGDSTAKRLSIVREESISKDRRSGQKMGPKTAASGHRRNNTTIIEFSENGTVVNSTLISADSGGKKEAEDKEGRKKLADICFVSKQSETKTVIVEVHRSASTNSIAVGSPASSSSSSSSSGNSTVSSGSTSHIPPPPPLFADKIPPPPPPSSGLSSGYSTTNSAKSGGMGGIGGQQQQRSPSSVSLADSSASSGIDCGSTGGGGIGGLGNAISEELKRRAEKKGTLSSTALEPAAALTELENRLKEKRFRPPNAGKDAARHSALMDEFKAVHKRMFKNGFDNVELKKSPPKDKLPIEVRPPGVATTKTNQGTAAPGGGSQSKGTMGRVAASELAKANGDIAELESIESFQLNSPQPTVVRPPSYYFCPQNTGPLTMKKSQKPIAVTISEYIGGGPEQPKKPTRIDFGAAGDSIGNLKYELEKTLSLSNLRQRSESREDLVERIQIGYDPQLEQGGKLSRSSSVANVGGRSGSSATTVSNGNRITIAISNGAEKK